MKTGNLLREVQSHGGTIWTEGSQLELRIPDNFPEALIEALREHKAELLAVLRWPPPDAANLVVRWKELGRPEIPLFPGMSVGNLERWFPSPAWATHMEP